jgi:hypothetical protein
MEKTIGQKRSEIEKHAVWQYISGLSNTGRYRAINGNRGDIEKVFNVKIEEWPFTSLNKIPSDWMYISATDPDRNIAMIMVLNPEA